MKLQLGKLTEERLQALCTWHYEPPYHIYQWGPYEKLQTKDEPIADPIKREQQFVAVLSGEEALVGFIEFQEHPVWTVLGLGLQPTLTSRGLGKQLVGLAVEEAKRRDPQKPVSLEVLRFNERAIKCYLASGFTITEAYERPTPTGIGAFYRMVYEE